LLARRVRLYRERVYFAAHHRSEQFVNHAMPRLQRVTGEPRGYKRQTVMTAAAFGAFVPDVERGFIRDLDRVRVEGREPVAYLVGYCQPRAAMWWLGR
jgi:hypothetical protein